MLRCRTTIGLSLLCALLVCAFAATQSALAAPATNTTMATCVLGGLKDFSDAHCDNSVPAGTGKYGHLAILLGPTSISVSNTGVLNGTKEASPAVFKGTVFGVKSEFTCNTVSGEGSLSNVEPKAKEHTVEGTIEAKITKCTVNKPAGFGCKVKEPITISSNVQAVQELGAGKNEAGLEFTPAGEHFASLVVESCFLAGTYNFDGTAIATSNTSNTGKFTGTTSVFTNAMTRETLKLAGNAAEFSSTGTITMSGGGNPVSYTTTT